jgi:hypothetical protein
LSAATDRARAASAEAVLPTLRKEAVSPPVSAAVAGSVASTASATSGAGDADGISPDSLFEKRDNARHIHFTHSDI